MCEGIKQLIDEGRNEGISIGRDDTMKDLICKKLVKVTQLDYTWERRVELIRREEYEEGIQQGRQLNEHRC